jgi:hypothetical protein
MSLTSQQRSGELGDWMAVRFAGAHELAREVQHACGQVPRPVLPIGGHRGGDHPWAAIGGTFGQRLAFLVQHAPPYFGLAGTLTMEMADWPDLHHAAAAFPTHAQLPASRRSRAWDWRPTSSGWIDVGPSPTDPIDQPSASPAGVVEFSARLVEYLTRHCPPGTLAASVGAEARLMRACWVLSAWEDGYRRGCLDVDYMTEDIGQLLALADEPVITELVALSTRAHTSGALTQLRHLASNPGVGEPLGIAGPVFVPHWADGDLVIGDTLIDVKTIASVRDTHRITRWLHQLLGYAWLDGPDRYGIRDVGLYLARHGVLLTWSVERFAHTLTGTTDSVGLTRIRDEFERLTARVIQAEGANPAFALPHRAGHTSGR